MLELETSSGESLSQLLAQPIYRETNEHCDIIYFAVFVSHRTSTDRHAYRIYNSTEVTTYKQYRVESAAAAIKHRFTLPDNVVRRRVCKDHSTCDGTSGGAAGGFRGFEPFPTLPPRSPTGFAQNRRENFWYTLCALDHDSPSTESKVAEKAPRIR